MLDFSNLYFKKNHFFPGNTVINLCYTNNNRRKESTQGKCGLPQFTDYQWLH